MKTISTDSKKGDSLTKQAIILTKKEKITKEGTTITTEFILKVRMRTKMRKSLKGQGL